MRLAMIEEAAMQSKYYIRISDITAPAPIYLQRIDSKGKPVFTGSTGFAKRYDNISLAEEIAAKLRSQTSERDGESCTIEIIDTQTDKPVGETDDEPMVVSPPPIPPFPGTENGDGWDVRFKFVQCTTNHEATLEMKKTPEGIITRYKPLLGSYSKEFSKAAMTDAVNCWIDCIRAWLLAQIEQSNKAVKK